MFRVEWVDWVLMGEYLYIYNIRKEGERLGFERRKASKKNLKYKKGNKFYIGENCNNNFIF